MQLCICCSSRAGELPNLLRLRLHRNLGVQTLIINEDAPLWEIWEDGAASDAMLLLLDEISAPSPLNRKLWDQLIEQGPEPPIRYAQLEPCAYPPLLKRRPFFPTEQIERTVERWLAEKLPALPGLQPASIQATPPDEWWPELVDKPGRATTRDASAAQAFANQAAGHFQRIIWIGSAGREAALIKAELDHRAADGRTLFILAHIEEAIPVPIDSHSYIQVLGRQPAKPGDPAIGACYSPTFPGWLAKELGADLTQAVPLDHAAGLYRLAHPVRTDAPTRQRHLEILHRYFQGTKAEPDRCRSLLPEVPTALQYGFAHDWKRSSELCLRAADLWKTVGRRLECIRLLEHLVTEADARADRETAEAARHELSWLTDKYGPINTAEPVQQLRLVF